MKVVFEHPNPPMGEGQGVAFCPHCASVIREVFAPNDWVYIRIPKTQPFYGRVVRCEKTDGGPMVLIDTGDVSVTPVLIDYVDKVMV